MSYILDALKRAEQERQFGQLPNATAAPAADKHHESQRWPWLALAALLLACLAATASYWLARTRTAADITPHTKEDATAQPAIKDSPPGVQPPVSAAMLTSITALPTRVIAKTIHPVMLPTPATTTIQPKIKPATTRTPVATPPKPRPVAAPITHTDIQPTEPTVPPVPAALATTPASDTSTDRFSLPWLNEMPSDFRQSAPNIDIQFHRHTDNRSSNFVMIGGQRYRDGDILESGPTLERIVEEGLVLYWRSKRFIYPIGG